MATPRVRKRAAIRPTASQLGQLRQSDFLAGLERGSVGRLVILPEKKKRELWVDEFGGRAGINLGTVLRRIREEKKKVELEVPISVRGTDPGPIISRLADEIGRQTAVRRRAATARTRRRRG